MYNHDAYWRARRYADTLETAELEYNFQNLQFLIGHNAKKIGQWSDWNARPHYMDGDQLAADMARAAAYYDTLSARKDAAKKAAGVMGLGACV